MKKLLLLVMLVFGVSLFALAKDGPFPMKKVAGIWYDPANGDTVEIAASSYAGKPLDYQVSVVVRDAQGKVLVSGTVVQSKSDEDLRIPAADALGRSVVLNFQVVGNLKVEDQYQLVMTATSGYENGSLEPHRLKKR